MPPRGTGHARLATPDRALAAPCLPRQAGDGWAQRGSVPPRSPGRGRSPAKGRDGPMRLCACPGAWQGPNASHRAEAGSHPQPHGSREGSFAGEWGTKRRLRARAWQGVGTKRWAGGPAWQAGRRALSTAVRTSCATPHRTTPRRARSSAAMMGLLEGRVSPRSGSRKQRLLHRWEPSRGCFDSSSSGFKEEPSQGKSKLC